MWSWSRFLEDEPAARVEPRLEPGGAARKLRIATRRLVDAALSGGFKSAFRGSGLEFREVRAYAPGDDVRRIDWNVTARTSTPHVKTYAEERELEVRLVLDASRGMAFGTQACTKAEVAARAAALLAFAAARNQDKVGLTVAALDARRRTPCKKGLRQASQVARGAAEARGDRASALVEALEAEERLLRRRSVVFVLSDFRCVHAEAPRVERLLQRLNRRHDVVAVRIADPLELALPAAGPFVIDDLEGGGRHEVDGRSSAAREAWNAAARRRRSAEEAMFAKARVDVVDLSTEGEVELPFVALFKRRVAGKGGRA
jgi:uncharacterized protein (DUF58 family)